MFTKHTIIAAINTIPVIITIIPNTVRQNTLIFDNLENPQRLQGVSKAPLISQVRICVTSRSAYFYTDTHWTLQKLDNFLVSQRCVTWLSKELSSDILVVTKTFAVQQMDFSFVTN